LNYDTTATYRRTPKYLKTICSLTDFFIIIDEANDLDRRVWPYLKRIIDAGVPIVLAGLPKVRTFLTSEYPDILSRLKTLILYPIVVEDFIMEYKDFESDAIEQIYVSTKGDMRKFKEICTDCRDRVFVNSKPKTSSPKSPTPKTSFNCGLKTETYKLMSVPQASTNELNCSFVDVNLALEFLSDLPPH